MNNFQNQPWNNQQQNNQSQQNQSQPNSNPPNQQANNQAQPSWIMQIAGACLPVLMKQFTGQDMMSAGSPGSSNSMETQLMLTQVLAQQQLIINSQQDLTSRIVNLETRASQQFTGLAKQVQNLSSVRLTHEKKQIELHSNGNFQHQQDN